MTKTPQQTLKTIGHRKVREPGYFDDLSENQASPEAEIASSSVSALLAMAIVQDAFPERDLERVLQPTGTAMVVTVPGPDWIDPIADALEKVGRFGVTFRRGGGIKSTEKPSSGSPQVASILSTGLNVLGISQSPESTLPTALMTVADLRIDVGVPGLRVLRSVIFLVTGTRPRKITDGVVRGLGFDEISACIRRGTTSGECVRRLVAASRSKLRGDTLLSDVPLLQDSFGYAEAATWGLSLATAVAEWRRNERSWASIPERCAVISGPPGCGKSTYARTLAKTLDMPIVATSVSAWFASGGYLDQVLKAVDNAIAQAVAIGPAVLFIDEIESIPDRNALETGGRNTPYWNTLVSHILTQLDSAVSGTTSSLIVIGATNYPERLDAALVRPGRLNRIIHIPMPDTDAIAGIMRQHLGDDLPGVDLKPLAIAGQGASGAEIASWAKGARETAWTARRPMKMSDLVARVAPSDTRSPAAQMAISLHESGHAAGTELLSVGTLESVSIIGRGPYAGRTHAKLRAAEAMNADELDAFVVSILCGRAVDEHWGTATSGAAGGQGSDLAIATSLVASKHGSYGLGETLTYRGDPSAIVGLIDRSSKFQVIVEDDLRRLYEVARVFVSENADTIEAIARMPSGHEAAFARRITRTRDGLGHPLLDGRPDSYDAPAIHSDEVEALPSGARHLAGNRVTTVQAAEIPFDGGVFWGVQYHPEIGLDEVAGAVRRQADDLVRDGLALDKEGVEAHASRIEALHRDPARNDLRWTLGLDDEVVDAGRRSIEIRNFIARLARPRAARRGRG